MDQKPQSMRPSEARAQVWTALRHVMDPELDESVADLGFIQSLSINPTLDSSATTLYDVQIKFRLPTYWCAANFAFIMAEDIRERIAELPWAGNVTVELADHFTADEINRGINGGRSFGESFPDEGGGDVNGLRKLFRLKAFQRRQYQVLRCLLDDSGDTPDARRAILSMTRTELRNMSMADAEGSRLRDSYLEILPEFTRSENASGNPQFAFIMPNGQPIDAKELDSHLRQLRRTTTNIEFNSAICSSLLKARNG
jgi:metal-sulfur cluster biosynthetic enzyme